MRPHRRAMLLLAGSILIITGVYLVTIVFGVSQSGRTWWVLSPLFFGAAFSAWLVFVLERRRSLERYTQLSLGADELARGRLDFRFEPRGDHDFGSIAASLNAVAAQLEERNWNLAQMHHRVDAILSSMVHGVLIFDTDRRLLMLNAAATQLLERVPEAEWTNQVGNEMPDGRVRSLVDDVLKNGSANELELTVQNGETQVLQAFAAPLSDETGGVLVMLQDVTKIRRFEEIRRDFVANVSHELRTPITSVKGFIETLLDGEMCSNATARHFLDIALHQADRLNAIVEDLLSLSRIEQEEERGEISVGPASILGVMRSAMQSCQVSADDQGIELTLECEPALMAAVNAELLEQAIVNLIDNAVRYSESQQTVAVTGTATEDGLAISVKDIGSGIPKEHIPRIFERFYRVDKAKSRKSGGTGLGLAIVKHIVLAHGGSINVQSEPGKGSTFSIQIPR